VRSGGGGHDSVAGRWVMEVLVVVALGHDLYDEDMRSYGFATHVWETGGRDFARIETVSRRGGRGRVVLSSVEISAGDEGRMWGVKYIAGRWYAMMVKSMGSGSVWSGRQEVDGEMSCVVRSGEGEDG